MIEPGIYLNNGQNELLVGAVKYYKDKQYAYVIDEVNEIGFFLEIERVDDGFNFTRVQSQELANLLIIEFSDIRNILKEELEKNKNEINSNSTVEENNSEN